MTVTVFHFINN